MREILGRLQRDGFELASHYRYTGTNPGDIRKEFLASTEPEQLILVLDGFCYSVVSNLFGTKIATKGFDAKKVTCPDLPIDPCFIRPLFDKGLFFLQIRVFFWQIRVFFFANKGLFLYIWLFLFVNILLFFGFSMHYLFMVVKLVRKIHNSIIQLNLLNPIWLMILMSCPSQ